MKLVAHFFPQIMCLGSVNEWDIAQFKISLDGRKPIVLSVKANVRIAGTNKSGGNGSGQSVAETFARMVRVTSQPTQIPPKRMLSSVVMDAHGRGHDVTCIFSYSHEPAEWKNA